MLDVVVVGAGMAGLAAARGLVAGGLTVQILEARERIGGRAWTVELPGSLPIDMGCHWFHSADVNPLVPLARSLGFEVIEWGGDGATTWNRRRLGERFDEVLALSDAVAERSAGTSADRDPPLAELVPAGPWRAWYAARMSWWTGFPLDRISAYDLHRHAGTDRNWRTPAGLGALVRRFGQGLPVTLQAPVRRIGFTAGGVRVEGAWGSLEARAVVVTAPTPLLAEIDFQPGLPEAKRQAIADLPLGADNKVYFLVEGRPFGLEDNQHGSLHYDRERTASYHFHEFGRPTAEAYLGGPLSDELEAAGPAAMADFALQEIVGLYGAAVARQLTPACTTAWRGDPWARGAYSGAQPGRALAREALAEPVEGRLFFAGEACSVHPATCHGAYVSGLAAAEAIRQTLAVTA